jgi:hypothetical protein
VFGRFIPGLALPGIVALLAHASVATAAAAILAIAIRSEDRWTTTPRAILGDLLRHSGLLTSTVAAGALAVSVLAARSSVLAADLLWLALVWLLLSWQYAAPPLFAAVQAALSGAVVFAVAALLERRGWYAASPHPWLDPWSIQAQAIALGLLCLVWIGVRLAVRPLEAPWSARARTLLDPPWPAFDRCLRAGILLALVVLAIEGARPGVAGELASRDLASSSAKVVPNAHALGPGSSLLLVLVLAVLLAGEWERFRPRDLLAALVAVSMAVPLVAGRWEGARSAASALAWSSAVLLPVVSALIWGRDRLARGALRLGWRFQPGETAGLKERATAIILVLALVPLLAVPGFVIVTELTGSAVAGPLAGSFFAGIGPAGSYALPIAVAAATLAGHAIRERSSAFAFAAAIHLNLAATAADLLAGGPAPLVLDAERWTRLALLNAIVSALSALAWIGAVALRQRQRREAATAGMVPDELLTALVGLGLALDVLVLVAGTTALFIRPVPGAMHAVIAGFWGWSAMVLAGGTFLVWGWRYERPMPSAFLGLDVLSAVAFLALALARGDPGDWRTFHGVLAGQALAAGALLLVVWQRSGMELAALAEDVRTAVGRSAAVALGVVVLFALRAYAGDPQGPWWTVGGLAGMAPLAAALAVWLRRPGLLGLAGILLNVAVTCWACWRPTGGSWADLVNLNIFTLALPVPLWLAIELRFLRPEGVRLAGGRWLWVDRVERIPFARVAAWVALGFFMLVVAVGLASDAAGGGDPLRPGVVLGGAALAAVAVALGAGLWDERSRGSVAGLYLLGLCGSGWALHQLHLEARWLVLTGTVVVSAYSVATSYLWSRRNGLRALADRLRIPRPDAEDPLAGLWWLAPANVALAAVVLALTFGTILTEPEALLRSLAAHAALAEVLATGLLAQGERRLRLQQVALGVGVAGAVAWGWAWVAPAAPMGILDRLVVVLVVLAAASALYGLGLVKLLRRENEWTRAALQLVPGLVALGAGVLAVVLVVEVIQQSGSGRVAMSAPAVVAVALALLAAGAAALIAALVPGRDPLGLPERARTGYVYGCELLLAVLVLHLRLTMPWLFSGFFARYRPLIIVGVAYLGVGLSELFRRQGRLILAEPLERTGALLPALPLLGAYWLALRPGMDVLFLVLAGGLYTGLSLLRSSLGFGALAALAYNAALWVVLGRQEGLGLLEHPQLWVVPPASCVLVGAYLNRDRLSEAQITSIRYAASLAIYLSSTGDIILTGVAQAPWLPLVLAALALVGIFAGIALRVRGFFLLGLGFLGLSLLTIIWYAAVDLRQTWLWSASGIVAGFLILALFALFEKKRQDVLRVVEEFKQWNP